MSLPPEILAKRRLGITATDAAAIAGLSPYKSPAEVWMDKKHPEMVDEFKESKALKWGTIHEPAIRREYAERTNQEIDQVGIISNPKVPWLMCMPDGIIKGKRKGLECKTADSRMSWGWGPEGTDQVPEYHLLQVTHSMMVTRFTEWDLAALIGGNDFRIYTLFRDVDLMKVLFEQEKEFYERFIAGSETPAFDWGGGVAKLLNKKYPKHGEDSKPLFVDTNGSEELKRAILSLIAARDKQDENLELEEAEGNVVKLYMKDCPELIWEEKRIKMTWKTTKDGVKVKWKDLAQELLARITDSSLKQTLLARHTDEKPGTRCFRVYDRPESKKAAKKESFE